MEVMDGIEGNRKKGVREVLTRTQNYHRRAQPMRPMPSKINGSVFALGDSSRYPYAMSARLGVPKIVKPKRKSAPYPFILEALIPLNPEVRPLFSGFAVYLGDKIVLMLRDSPNQPEDNGVWLVFSEVANLTDAGIRRDFPSLRIIGLLGGKIDHWRLIP